MFGKHSHGRCLSPGEAELSCETVIWAPGVPLITPFLQSDLAMCQLCDLYQVSLSYRSTAELSPPASTILVALPCAGFLSLSLVPGGPLSGRSSLCTSSVPGPCEPEDLIDGIIFAANYLGSTQLLSERNPSKNIRMMQAQEAVSRVKVGYFWALRAAWVGPWLGGCSSEMGGVQWSTGALSSTESRHGPASQKRPIGWLANAQLDTVVIDSLNTVHTVSGK